MRKVQRTATALALLSSSTFTIVLMSYGTVVPGWLRAAAAAGKQGNNSGGGGGAAGTSTAMGLRRYLPDGEVRVGKEPRHPPKAAQRTTEGEEIGGGLGIGPPPPPPSAAANSSLLADETQTGPGGDTGGNATASSFAWDHEDWHTTRCYYVEDVCRTSHRWFYRDDGGEYGSEGGPDPTATRKRKHQPDLVWATSRPGERPPNYETVYKRYYRIQRLGGGNTTDSATAAAQRGLLDSCTTSAVTNHVRDQGWLGP
jgi:hypothetical protein